jgi:hypothetical protein
MAPNEIKQVRREVEALNRYRNLDTSAWIDLVQAELVELAEGATFEEVAASERSRQIVTLGKLLFPDTAAPTSRDIAQH